MELTCETPAPGVVIAQPARGFRYTSDAMWLAGFALEVGPRGRALDLGTGSGVVAFLLAAHGLPVRGIEKEAAWRDAWAESVARSRPAAPVELVIGDVRDDVGGPYDLVVANPPFFAAHTGPVSPDPLKRAARTESGATLADFLAVGCGALAPGGRMCVIAPREREGELLAGPLPAVRWARIGRRRTLAALGEGERGPVEEVDEQTAARWVRRATEPGRRA